MFNFNGTNLVIATNHQPPFVSLETKGSVTKLTDGFEFELLKIFSDIFNFTYSVMDCQLNWGTLLPNRSWTGIIGQLAQNHADIGFCELSMTEDRSEAVHFSYPYNVETITFFTSSPKLLRNNRFIFQVFESRIWVSILTAFLISFFISYLGKTNRNKGVHFGWNLLKLLLEQNIFIKKQYYTHNSFLLYSWILSCAFLTWIYTNCLYTFMLLPGEPDKIDSLQKLYEALIEENLTVKIRERTSSYRLLQKSNILIYQGIFEHANVLTYKDVLGIETIPNSIPPSAFIASKEFINYHCRNFEENSYYMPRSSEESTFFIEFTTFAFSNNFKHKQHFDKSLKWMQNTGILEHWMEHYKIKKDFVHIHSKRIVNLLKLFNHEHFTLYLYILFGGHLIAIIVIFCEIFNSKRIKTNL